MSDTLNKLGITEDGMILRSRADARAALEQMYDHHIASAKTMDQKISFKLCKTVALAITDTMHDAREAKLHYAMVLQIVGGALGFACMQAMAPAGHKDTAAGLIRWAREASLPDIPPLKGKDGPREEMMISSFLLQMAFASNLKQAVTTMSEQSGYLVAVKGGGIDD